MAGAGVASAQSYRIDVWTADDGLPQSSVNRIIQTRDGFLWLATFAGLVRYDGARFEVFNPVTTPSLRASRFTNLFEDAEGALWASSEGQGVVRYRDGRFQTFGIADGLPNNTTAALRPDRDGQLVIDDATGSVKWTGTRFAPHTPDLQDAQRVGARVMLIQPSGAVWYLNEDRLYKREDGRVTRQMPAPPAELRWMFEDVHGAVWIEIAEPPDGRRSLLRWDGTTFRRFTAADGMPTFRTMSAFDARDGATWFGLRAEGGLLRFKDGGLTRFTMTDGLPSNNVTQVVEDREGTIWVATEGGLARLTPRAVVTHGLTSGLAAENSYPIYEDADGSVLIGGWPGLTRYRDGRFVSVGAEHGVADKAVLSLLRDRSGVLWIGLWGWNGLRRVSNGVVDLGERSSPAGGVVRAIYQDRSGEMWFGGNEGLTRMRDGVFTRVNADAGFAGRVVFSLRSSADGTLWIGTDLGVSAYRDGRFTNYDARDGMLGTNVRAIYQSADGVMWFGTYDTGLFRFEGGRFHRYTTREGLFDNGVFQILEDQRGNFWMSSNAGIYRVARRQLDLVAQGRARSVVAVPYGRRDGMTTAESNGGGQPAGVRARDGRLWFPTQKGVAVIDADKVTTNPLAPPVVITGALVDQQPVALGTTLSIAPNQATFEIAYAGLTFRRPELTRFRYKLEGLDHDWIDVGARRTAYFSHVPEGRYTFRVIAANADGVWSEQDAALAVVVVPPFYRTVWFQAVLGLVVAGFAYGLHRSRVRTLEQQQALRDSYARQLIDAQERDRKRIAAEVHDSLSQNLVLIGNWARQVQPAVEHVSARGVLEDISTTAATALREVQEIAYNLGPYQLDRLGFQRTIETLVARAASASGIHFTTDVGAVNGLAAKDVEVSVYRMIQECVNNIMKHSGASEAAVRITRGDGHLAITIQDNGRGFERHRPEGAPQGGPGRGFGLVGLGERARILGGTCEIDSAPGFGTRVDVTLPLSPVNGDEGHVHSTGRR